MNTEIELEEATETELKAYARDDLGLSLTMNMKKETMVQRIRDELDKQNKPEPVIQPDTAAADRKADWVGINVQKTGDKGGGQPVFVGYNYKGYTIPRGVDVKVPPGVEYVLRKAVRTVYEQDDDTGQMVSRDTLSYPYQVVSGFENRIQE